MNVRPGWATAPLGVATLSESGGEGLAVSHVLVDSVGPRATGMWVFPDPSKDDLTGRLVNWIIVGSSAGVSRAESVLGEKLGSADIDGFITAGQAAEAKLEGMWEAHRAAEPSKRINLAPLAWPTWPDAEMILDPIAALKSVKRMPYPRETPPEIREALALSRLMTYVLTCWSEIEDERLARPYLRGSETGRRLMPPDWLADNPSWWPTAA